MFVSVKFAQWVMCGARRYRPTAIRWPTRRSLLQKKNLLALDTGCVWGGSLTAMNLDDPEARPVSLACRAHQNIE